MASRNPGPIPGLTDKRYWRMVDDTSHCFKKRIGGGYVSLCGRHESKRSGGQECNRPPPYVRCAMCDVAEMDRVGADESLPASKGWSLR